MPRTLHALVINPNTSASVTERLLAALSPGLRGVQLHGATAAFGAPYIADEASYCIAGHAVLDAWTRAQVGAPAAGYAAVLVGCFGDPGLHALREVAGMPVLGLAQAAVLALQRQGHQRIAIVTGGEKWAPMLQRWARAEGHAVPPMGSSAQIVHITALPATGLQMMQAPEATARTLAEACAHACGPPARRPCCWAAPASPAWASGCGLSARCRCGTAWKRRSSSCGRLWRPRPAAMPICVAGVWCTHRQRICA